MDELKLLDKRKLLNKHFKIYGDFDNPLFLAKDVAEWIDYSKKSNGSYDVNSMLRMVDEDEKLIRKISVSGRNRNMWFLTEDGFYEVCMQSTKPNAKQFKKEVKKILKDIRKSKMYLYHNVLNVIVEKLNKNNNENYYNKIEFYEDKIYKLEKENEKLKKDIKYLYSEEDYHKKNEIKKSMDYYIDRERAIKYVKLYKLFKEKYGIDLKKEHNEYNKLHKGLSNISILHFCLLNGYIKDLYDCYKILFIKE